MAGLLSRLVCVFTGHQLVAHDDVPSYWPFISAKMAEQHKPSFYLTRCERCETEVHVRSNRAAGAASRPPERIVISVAANSVARETKEEMDKMLGPVAWLEYNPVTGTRPAIDVVRIPVREGSK
jgi:hypothetical protein